MSLIAPGVKALRESLLEEAPHCCYCGRQLNRRLATAEHILPRCRGGTTTRDNVALACRKCNLFKGERTPAEFAALLQRILANLESVHR